MSSPTSSGGSATTGGVTFQARVAAWYGVRILADSSASSLFDLPHSTILNYLGCETGQSVDDILVAQATGGRIYIQVKRSLDAEEGSESEFASVISQFVKQFNAHRLQASSQGLNLKPLDEKDRLVLTVGPTASGKIRNELSNILNRARALTPEQTIDSTAVNADEQGVLIKLKKHLNEAWQKLIGSPPSNEDLKGILRLAYVQTLNVESGGNDETSAKDLLSSAVLKRPSAAGAVWSSLLDICLTFGSTRTGGDRGFIQARLIQLGFDLKWVQSFDADIQKLKNQTQMTIQRLCINSLMKIGSTQIKINRSVVTFMDSFARGGDCLVVGEPGAGKSGVLHDFVGNLLAGHKEVVFLNAGFLSVKDLTELKGKLQLEHEILEVFQNWIGQEPAYFVLDSLDAIRDDVAFSNFKDLIRLLMGLNSRWHVVVSIRKYDLRHSRALQALFRDTGCQSDNNSEFQDQEFSSYRHVSVSGFSDPELFQIDVQSTDLYQVVRNATGELKVLLRNPFNLHLVAELLEGLADISEISSVSSQIDLLDKYWYYRVERNDHQRDARSAILRKACEKMIGDKKLIVERSLFSNPAESQFLGDLLSTGVIIEFQSSLAAIPDSDFLTYSHHVLFDYAVERLILRGDVDRVVQTLVADPGLSLMIRPSIVMHFNNLWAKNPDRKEFWNFIFKVMGGNGIPEIGKLIGLSVVAEKAKSLGDLAELQRALESTDLAVNELAQASLTHLIGSLLVKANGNHLSGPDAEPWCQFLERLSAI